MSKETFYRITIVALLLLNLGVLGFMWLGGGHHEGRPPWGGRNEGPAGFIIEKLQLDEAQQAKFQVLRDAHHHRDMELREQSGELHDELFSLLKNETVDSAEVDSLYKQIALNDAAKEQLNFNHFKDLKTLLRPYQQHLYNEFIEDIAHQFGPPRH